MEVSFEFDRVVSPVLGEIRRPVALVSFFSHKRGRWYEIAMVVDTGADYTLLPLYFATRLGVNLQTDCKLFQTSGVGGMAKVYFLESVKAKIGAMVRSVPLGFLNSNNVPPLLGRHMFLETFDTLFSRKHIVTFSE